MDAPSFNGTDDREQVCSQEPLTCECPECRKWRDNIDPDDPDGEAFRGEEAAAFEREQQAEAQRLK